MQCLSTERSPISYGRDEEALHIRCDAYGATETVPGYGQGEQPAHFLFQSELPYGWARMQCRSCAEHSEHRKTLELAALLVTSEALSDHANEIEIGFQGMVRQSMFAHLRR